MALSNDVSMSHHPDHHTNHPVMMIYKECLRNRLASTGGYDLDGCDKFMPSSTIILSDPKTIKCANCGCHQNFHRCEPKEPPISRGAHHAPENQPHQDNRPPSPPPHHDNHPPSPPPQHTTNFASPQPISIYPPAPLMVRSNDAPENAITSASKPFTPIRFRTKFTWWQKEKMYEFSKKVGWKTRKLDKEVLMKFCDEIGVSDQTLEVWMRNNKNTFEKKYNIKVNSSTSVNDNDNDNYNLN